MSRIKTVFGSHAHTAHVWAQQTHDIGYSSDKRMFFEGRAIYSYGRHFPLAYFYSDDLVILNSDSYSVSTSKHQSIAHRAVVHKRLVYMPTRVIDSIGFYQGFTDTPQNMYLNHVLSQFENVMIRATKRRIKKCKARDVSEAIGILETGTKTFETFYLPIPSKLQVTLDAAKNENDDYVETYMAQLQAEEQKQKDKEKALYIDAKARWIDYDDTDTRGLRYGAILMRVKLNDPETIETSRGAEFPLEHGLKAFNFIRAMKERSISWDKISHQKTIHLGHFKIDTIDALGNVKAGCHFIEWQEIERLARLLKIYP